MDNAEKVQAAQWLAHLANVLKDADVAANVECVALRDAIDAWHTQPAQYVVPWVLVDGLNVRGWAERWHKCCIELRELQAIAAQRVATATGAAGAMAQAGVGAIAADHPLSLARGLHPSNAFSVSPSKQRL